MIDEILVLQATVIRVLIFGCVVGNIVFFFIPFCDEVSVVNAI